MARVNLFPLFCTQNSRKIRKDIFFLFQHFAILIFFLPSGNNMVDDFSDSENEDSDDNFGASMKIDDWISFKSESLRELVHLRQKWSALLLRRLKTPGKPFTSVDETLIRNLVNILTEEEQNCSLFQSENIGQRPKQLSTMSN